MRREATVLVTVGLGLLLSSCGCPEGQECVDPDEIVQAEPCPSGQVCMKAPDPRGDVVAGCDDANPKHGAGLVKVRITLAKGGERGCVVSELVPETVCVVQGGAIRWKVVDDGCGLTAEGGNPIVEITGSEIEWLTAVCNARFPSLVPGGTRANEVFCNLPDKAALGDYKYGVEGPGVDRLDPTVKVKGPGGR